MVLFWGHRLPPMPLLLVPLPLGAFQVPSKSSGFLLPPVLLQMFTHSHLLHGDLTRPPDVWLRHPQNQWCKILPNASPEMCSQLLCPTLVNSSSLFSRVNYGSLSFYQPLGESRASRREKSWPTVCRAHVPFLPSAPRLLPVQFHSEQSCESRYHSNGELTQDTRPGETLTHELAPVPFLWLSWVGHTRQSWPRTSWSHDCLLHFFKT